MPTGTAKRGPYSDYERVTELRKLPNVRRHPSAIMAARRSTIVDLLVLDGSIRPGLRLTKGTLYDIDFLQVLKSTPKLSQSELWVFYLPFDVRLVTNG